MVVFGIDIFAERFVFQRRGLSSGRRTLKQIGNAIRELLANFRSLVGLWKKYGSVNFEVFHLYLSNSCSDHWAAIQDK